MTGPATIDIRPGAELRNGRYRLERVIGVGGMAAVWLACDQRLERTVAVKLLSDNLASDPAYVRRFNREARTAAGLSHPNLVKVYDYEPEGRPAVIMEYVDGGTLEDATEPVDVESLALQLLGALEHIHAAGIVHRDVKPANVLIAADGRPMLTDFGIAQHEDASRLTQTGQVLGTLAYMAPEMLEGDRATPRSDLYSCGVVLRDHLTPESPTAVKRLIERLTERDPALRPASATQALAYLGGPGAGAAARRTPTEPMQIEAEDEGEKAPPARPGAIRGRHVLAALALLAAVIAVIAIASGGGGESGQTDKPAKPADHAATTAEPQDTAAPADQTETTTTTTPAEPAAQAETPVPAPKPNADPAKGAELEQTAFGLLESGDAASAVKEYEKALAQFPDETRSPDAFDSYPNYAYALYSYADALIQVGRADEAVPVLEERLGFADQQDTVEAKLAEAQAASGQ